jgi:type IV secretion system protein VirB10
MIAAAALIAGLLLVWILESRHGPQPQPAVHERFGDRRVLSPEPPPLYIPPVVPAPPEPAAEQQTELSAETPEPQSQPRFYPSPEPQSAYYPPEPPMPAVRDSKGPDTRAAAGPALVIDTTSPLERDGNSRPSGSAAPGVARADAARVRASGLANPSRTVPQGVLIPAVLETAFDSNHPGFARAIVSRDVRSFDGTRLLIPRGSRVVGEYGADAAPGQNRALIVWTRLIRPDGVTIALDSPAVDTLGRGGVRASVNTHFWDRFGNAILNSTVEIGAGVAAAAAVGPLLVVPGAVQRSLPQQETRYVPTLKVRPGKSISIFVARDLEFPERGPQ